MENGAKSHSVFYSDHCHSVFFFFILYPELFAHMHPAAVHTAREETAERASARENLPTNQLTSARVFVCCRINAGALYALRARI